MKKTSSQDLNSQGWWLRITDNSHYSYPWFSALPEIKHGAVPTMVKYPPYGIYPYIYTFAPHQCDQGNPNTPYPSFKAHVILHFVALVHRWLRVRPLIPLVFLKGCGVKGRSRGKVTLHPLWPSRRMWRGAEVRSDPGSLSWLAHVRQWPVQTIQKSSSCVWINNYRKSFLN